MNDSTNAKKWQEAQSRVLIAEYRKATGKAATSMDEVDRWFIGLPLAERDRVSRRMNDPVVVGRHLQTPRIH
jgi:hypothetical protein